MIKPAGLALASITRTCSRRLLRLKVSILRFSSTLLSLLRYSSGCRRVRVDCCCGAQEPNPVDALRTTSAAFSTFTGLRSALDWRHLLRRSFSFACIHRRHAREWSLFLSCRASDPSPLSTRKTCRLEERQSSLDPRSQHCPDSSFRAGSPPCPIRQT